MRVIARRKLHLKQERRSKPMTAVFRIVGAIVAAMAVALVLVIAVELFSSVVHPTPADFKGTHEEMCAHVANYPQWVLAAVVPMWGFTAFVSTWLAGRLGNRGCAVFLAVLLLAAVIFNLSMLPYPAWFKVVQPIVILIAVAYGYRLSNRRMRSAD
jgi:hypothetical protein